MGWAGKRKKGGGGEIGFFPPPSLLPPFTPPKNRKEEVQFFDPSYFCPVASTDGFLNILFFPLSLLAQIENLVTINI